MPYKNPKDPKNVATLKASSRAQHLRVIERNRTFVWRIKQGPCSDCGECFHPCAMDFDHVLGEKKHTVGYLMGSHSLERLKAEIEKCELVCSNCHRKRTFDRLGNDEGKVVGRGWSTDALDRRAEYSSGFDRSEKVREGFSESLGNPVEIGNRFL